MGHAEIVTVLVCLSLLTVTTAKLSCPPAITKSTCEKTCRVADDCDRTKICCPTDCGGRMCIEPVTQQMVPNYVKPGKCPSAPGGVWICTSTCRSDTDCPRALKCCKNRCGAKTCLAPTTAVMESAAYRSEAFSDVRRTKQLEI